MKPGDRVLHRWEDRGWGVVESTSIVRTRNDRGQVVRSYLAARVKWTGGVYDSSDLPADSLRLADIVTAIGTIDTAEPDSLDGSPTGQGPEARSP